MSLQRVMGAFLLTAILSLNLAASPADDLQSASKAGQVALVLVTEPGAADVGEAKQIIQNAQKQIKRKPVLVELNRADDANAPLVAQYRLSGAPVPLILVFASNGALAGGMPAAQATSEQLIKMIPTPKKAEVLKALQSGQSVFLTASRKGMATKSEVLGACALACGQMRGKSISIQIDMDDSAELPFLTDLRINPQSPEPVTVVINAGGQVTGSFSGAVAVGGLVQAATKTVGGCCPSGSGKSCGPTKK